MWSDSPIISLNEYDPNLSLSKQLTLIKNQSEFDQNTKKLNKQKLAKKRKHSGGGDDDDDDIIQPVDILTKLTNHQPSIYDNVGRINVEHCNTTDNVYRKKSSKSIELLKNLAMPPTIYDDVERVKGKKCKKITNACAEQPKQLCSKTTSNILKIGQSNFISTDVLYKMEFDDYCLITNSDFTNYRSYAPKAIKPLLKDRWFYVMHVSHGMSLSITRSTLNARVNGGEILAYKYTECSMSGNDCAYYGFIPTKLKTSENYTDTHRMCHFALSEIWPRKIYIYLKMAFSCDCSDDCTQWQMTMADGVVKKQFCLKKLPWSLSYIIMGDVDETCIEQIKPLRECIVCAQCINCSKNTTYCRIHKICRHKKTLFKDDADEYRENFANTILKKSKIKACTKYRQ